MKVSLNKFVNICALYRRSTKNKHIRHKAYFLMNEVSGRSILSSICSKKKRRKGTRNIPHFLKVLDHSCLRNKKEIGSTTINKMKKYVPVCIYPCSGHDDDDRALYLFSASLPPPLPFLHPIESYAVLLI